MKVYILFRSVELEDTGQFINEIIGVFQDKDDAEGARDDLLEIHRSCCTDSFMVDDHEVREKEKE